MRILLTGANGYVGSEIALHLQALGHELHLLIRKPFDATPAPLKLCSIYYHDLIDPLPQSLPRVDVVIHAAGGNDIVSKNPKAALDATVLSTKHVLDYALTLAQPKLIYVSTIQVYGLSHGVIDPDTPCQPNNTYGLTHYFAEQWIQMAHQSNGLHFAIARLGNITGLPSATAMNRWSLVPGCFCLEAFQTGRITLHSSGKQQKDFLDLSHIGNCMAKLCRHLEKNHIGIGNIVSQTAISIVDVANLCSEIYQKTFDKPCPIFVNAIEPSDSLALQLRCGSAFETICPKLSKEDALMQMRNSIRQYYLKLRDDHGPDQSI